MAAAITCPKCGASLPVSDGATLVSCSNCRIWVDVPEELLPISALSAQKKQDRIVSLIRSGQKDQAVQLYQEGFKVSPVEARNCVDELERDATWEKGLLDRDGRLTNKHLVSSMVSAIHDAVPVFLSAVFSGIKMGFEYIIVTVLNNPLYLLSFIVIIILIILDMLGFRVFH